MEDTKNFLSDETIRRALGASQMALCIVDVLAEDHPIVYMNEAFETLTGYGRQEILGRTREGGIVAFANSTAVELFGAESVDRLIGVNMLDLVHADNRTDVVARRQQVLQGTRPPFALRRRLRLDGSDFYSESRGVPFAWDGGAAILIMIRDITARRETEEQLRQALKMEAVG